MCIRDSISTSNRSCGMNKKSTNDSALEIEAYRYVELLVCDTLNPQPVWDFKSLTNNLTSKPNLYLLRNYYEKTNS